jgi:hypothetical protein
MKKYQNSLLAGVAALALVAGTGLASAQQSKEHTGGSQAASPQAAQPMNKGSQTQAQEKGKATQTQAQEKGKGTATQAQEKGKAETNRTAQGKENMSPSGQESQKMGKRGERAERGAKSNRQAERKDTLKGLHGDTTKPMQGENEKQEGSKSSTKGNTSNQAQQKTPQNNMQRGTESTQRGTESNQGSAEVRGGGSRTAEGVNVQLNEQQRTEIKTTVIEGRNAPRVGHVDFDVRVGTVIPRGKIHVVPVPETLVRIEPRWRGFLYFVYEDEIVVVDPHNYHIVAVLPV